MNVHAELLDSSVVGSTVRVFYKEGKLVASKSATEGHIGLINTLQGKVAFITIINDSKLDIAPTSGSAVGIKIDIPIAISGKLRVTSED